MDINIKWCEVVIGALVILFALWQLAFSKWVLVLLGIIVLVHSITCKMCCWHCQIPAEKKVAGRKKTK